jgi:hypothetical protein
MNTKARIQMNYRSLFAIGSLAAAFVGSLCAAPANAQTISGLSNSTFTLNANSGGYDGQDATSHGVPALDDSTGTLQLTTNQGVYDAVQNSFFGSENTSAYYNNQVDVSNFTASFDYLYAGTNPDSFGPGNGFTFIVQNDSLNALGTTGFGNGQAGDPSTVTPSVALETNLFTGFGQAEGTGVAINGDPGSSNPTFFSTPGSVDLTSGDLINYSLSYNGADLTETLKDLTTSDTFTKSYAVDIASVLGGSDGYVGFTGGTGAAVANQYVSNFSFSSGTAAPAPESSSVIGLSVMLALGAGAMMLRKAKSGTI